MSCKNCNCLKCKERKWKQDVRKEKSPEERKKQLLKQSRLSYAIAALWKKIAKDWEKTAEEIK